LLPAADAEADPEVDPGDGLLDPAGLLVLPFCNTVPFVVFAGFTAVADVPTVLVPPDTFPVAGLIPVVDEAVFVAGVVVEPVAGIFFFAVIPGSLLSPFVASALVAEAGLAADGFLGGATISSVPCRTGSRRCPGVIPVDGGVASGLYWSGRTGLGGVIRRTFSPEFSALVSGFVSAGAFASRRPGSRSDKTSEARFCSAAPSASLSARSFCSCAEAVSSTLVMISTSSRRVKFAAG
jgi:hypothetical protein